MNIPITVRIICLCMALIPLFCVAAPAQEPGSSPTTQFDAQAATKAYLARPTAREKARSDSYFEGGYWLQLWQFLAGVGVSLLLLQTRLSARMRDLSCRLAPFKPLQTCAYAVQFIVLTSVLLFPLSVYSDFVREH